MRAVRPRWSKVLGDLAADRLGSILTIITLSLGVCAVAVFSGSAALVRSDYHAQYVAAEQPDLVVVLDRPGTEASIAAVRAIEGVADVEPRMTLQTSIRDGPGNWQPFELLAVADVPTWRVGRSFVDVPSGSLGRGEILIDRSAVASLGLANGSDTQVRLADGRTVDVRVAGTSQQPGRAAWFSGGAFGVTTFAALPELGRWDSLAIRLRERGHQFGLPGQDALLTRIADALAAVGPRLRGAELISQAGQTSLDQTLDGIDLVLNSLGAMAVITGSILAAGSIGAVIRRQRRQIGILQAIGASPGQLAALFVAVGGALVLPGLALGMALGVVGAHAMQGYVEDLINVRPNADLPPAPLLVAQLAIGLMVPLVFVVATVVRATRTTAAANLSDRTAGRVSAPQLIAVFERFIPLGSEARLGVRNLGRGGWPAVLRLVTLGLGGALFLAVVSVGAGLAALPGVDGADLAGYRIMSGFMGGVGTILLAMSMMALFASLLSTVVERQRELGVLVAMGASPARLGRVLVGEALFTVAGGWLIALVLWPVLAFPLGAELGQAFAGTDVMPRFGLEPFGLLAVLVTVALAAAAVPLTRAVRLDVVAALRYE